MLSPTKIPKNTEGASYLHTFTNKHAMYLGKVKTFCFGFLRVFLEKNDRITPEVVIIIAKSKTSPHTNPHWSRDFLEAQNHVEWKIP